MSEPATHPQTQIGGIQSEQESNTTTDQLKVSGDKKVKLERNRGPWGTIHSDKDSKVNETNTRAKHEREEDIDRSQPEVPSVKKRKLGQERGYWDQHTIRPALIKDEVRRTRVMKLLRPQFGPEELDKFRARHLADETTGLLISTVPKSSTKAITSGTKENDANTRTIGTGWHTQGGSGRSD